MKSFRTLLEMARRTGMANFYSDALQGLCRLGEAPPFRSGVPSRPRPMDPDWRTVLILADALGEQGDPLELLIRAANAMFAARSRDREAFRTGAWENTTEQPLAELAAAWQQFLATMNARTEARQMPYLLHDRMDSPVFYYVTENKTYQTYREYYVTFHVGQCRFTVLSGETQRSRTLNPEQVDEYILRCAVAYRIHYVAVIG